MTIKIGDVVYLKHQPAISMTVTHKEFYDGKLLRLWVVWFDDHKLRDAKLPIEVLNATAN